MTANVTPEFTRRKFTITERLDVVLVEMAEQHYQGNVSLCLRAAIESHQAILRGEGQFAARRVANALERLEEGQTELDSAIEALPETLVEQMTTESESRNSGSPGFVPEKEVVYHELSIVETPFRIEDLMERLEVGPATVMPALASLVDQGLVVSCGNDGRRYQLAGYGGQE